MRVRMLKAPSSVPSRNRIIDARERPRLIDMGSSSTASASASNASSSASTSASCAIPAFSLSSQPDGGEDASEGPDGEDELDDAALASDPVATYAAVLSQLDEYDEVDEEIMETGSVSVVDPVPDELFRVPEPTSADDLPPLPVVNDSSVPQEHVNKLNNVRAMKRSLMDIFNNDIELPPLFPRSQ
ncbi:hypothetical protein PBRA_009342 [Plasmodiophora brassicae]|uniref:Uncharacterized protein n=1 Tax=Plasmodiophora brassicae TaxID=37360 RepID=A0A0G4J714_PLABS|nr:hypothetical protein PBRA_009342 [Plasmodiophora brassicae]